MTSWNCGDDAIPPLKDQPWLSESLKAGIVAIGMQESKLEFAFSEIQTFYSNSNLVFLESYTMWHVLPI